MPLKAACLSHGAIVIMDTEEDPAPFGNTFAQFFHPLPRQLANMAALT